MRLLAILILGSALVWWFLFRSASEPAHSPSAGNHPSQTAQPAKAAQPAQNQPRPSPKAASSPADASSLVKRPLDRAREAIDANQKRLENEL